MNLLQIYCGIVFAVFSLGSVVCYNNTNSSYTDFDLSKRPLVKIYPEHHNTLYAPTSKPFILTCSAVDDGENVVKYVIWTIGNVIQDETNLNGTSLRKPSKNLLQLKFLSPQDTDSGSYSCFVVYSNNATVRVKVHVIFYDDIKFEYCNEHQSLLLGASGQIVCTIIGFPFAAQTSWLKDGSPISSDKTYTVLPEKLLVKVVTDDTQGLYTLEALVVQTGQLSVRSINVTVQNMPTTCSYFQFRCDNGRCVHRNFVCDGDNDCKDWSDERNCPTSTPTPCSYFRFRCGNGHCINRDYICNGNNDCGDWSDERNCPSTTSTPTPCSYFQFRCANGHCVHKNYVCDGDNDCGDWSDERNCSSTTTSPTTTPTRCYFGQFLCDNGNCILRNYVCDGDNDCGDWSDERGCVSSKGSNCSPGRFTCRNKRCIRARFVCDGDNDCGDFSDESDCVYHTAGTNTNFTAIIGVAIGFSVLIFILIPTIWCVKMRKQKKVAAAISAQPGTIGQTPHLPEGFNASQAAVQNGGSQEGVSVQLLQQQPMSGIVTRHPTAPYPSSELHQTQTLSEITQQQETVHSTVLPNQRNAPQQTTHQVPQSNLYPTLPHQAYPTAPEGCSE